MLQAFFIILQRDLILAIRHRAELMNPVLFFVLVVVLFPLGIGAEVTILERIAPGVIWIAALLSALLSLDRIFRTDMEDGSLEQMLISAQPMSLLILAKIIAHWMITGLPVVLVGPLLALFLGLSMDGIETLFITLLLGTPILSAIGSVGVALTVGLRRGGVILSLLVLPLYVPVLIFASQAVDAAAAGFPPAAAIAMLSALLLLSLSLTPWAASAALKMSVS
ncbi:ABC transporter involved in cytochrome c biogenesis, CcmB subunit [hydrothermal vent metagenome]|uniref:Heme exporter protein B n=1 Tax=hydrothermal vent metagenome TaxID=652676 RepID=A0A3B0ZTB8_9ZZZZ